MRLASLTWASDVALLVEAAKEAKTELKAFAISDLGDENVEDCIRSLNLAEAILLHPSNQDPLFDRVVAGIDKKIPIVSFGFDPSLLVFFQCSCEDRLHHKRLCGLWWLREHLQYDLLHRKGGSGIRLSLPSPQSESLAGPLPS